MTGPMIEREITLDAPAGALRAVLTAPDEPTAAVVIVDGSGDSTVETCADSAGFLADHGIASLRHDKPGCGGSPGDWREQSFADRAADALAAADLLRAEPGVSSVGLMGFSQGGWVSFLAAANEPDRVDFVITVGGPGVTMAEQERVRIERALRRDGLAEELIDRALQWVDERAARLAIGEAPARILAEQSRHAGALWYDEVDGPPYHDEGRLAFFARSMRFDPAAVVPHARCPILALFGSADDSVPVERSVAVLAERLPALRRGEHGLAVLPGAGHMLFVAEGVRSPAYGPILVEFVGRLRRPG